MASLYVVSLERNAGKTALCLGLGLELKARGIDVGYMKPLGTLPVEVGGALCDEDVVFILRALGKEEPHDQACPLLLTKSVVEEAIRGTVSDKSSVVQRAHDALTKRNPALIMEGAGGLAVGFSLGIHSARVAEITQASVVVITPFSPSFSTDELLLAKSYFGNRLIGAIMNNVPPEGMDRVKQYFPGFLKRNGMAFFGALPVDKLLVSIPIRELARLLNGEILNSVDKQDELVSTFSVGAMNVDTALKYFLKTRDKAVITGGDRADIQLAALQTPTKCIVLTGNLYPDAIILARAEEVGVPMILVKSDTMTAVATVEQALGHIRLESPQQISRLTEMVRTGLDLEAIQNVLKS